MRYFTISIKEGTSIGPFTVYYTTVSDPTQIIATLYNSTDKAENLTLSQLTGGNSIIIQVPDDVDEINVHDPFCSPTIFNPECILIVDIMNIEELTPIPQNTDCKIYVPDRFSPNDDGVSDYFVVTNLECYPINEMYIYSGLTINEKLVFRTKSYHANVWNGKINNNITDCNSGNYLWVLYINNKKYDEGVVMLSRVIGD